MRLINNNKNKLNNKIKWKNYSCLTDDQSSSPSPHFSVSTILRLP